MEKNTQMAKVNDSFTAKEEKFCYEYCIDSNATKAAIRAGYSGKTARSISCALLTKLNIQKKIKETQSDLAKAASLSAFRILEELKAIMESDIRDYLSFTGTTIKFKNFKDLTNKQVKAIAGIKKGKNGIELKLQGKSWAIGHICKMLGFDAATKNELTGKDGKDLRPRPDLSLLSDEESVIFHKLIVKCSKIDQPHNGISNYQEQFNT